MVCRWELVAEMFMAAVGRYKAYDISATPGRSISGCMKGAEIRKRKSRCVAVFGRGRGRWVLWASSDLIRDLGLWG
jgi:hypothetical protein